MLNQRFCNYCNQITDHLLLDDKLTCVYCNSAQTVTEEHYDTGIKLPKQHFEKDGDVLENGTIVTIINEDHVWSGEIALVCGEKPGHYRLELHGSKVWMPKNWVKTANEPDDVN